MEKRKSFYKWGKYLIVIGITLLMFLFYRSVERVPLLADDNMVFVKAVVVQNDHEDEQAQASLDSGDTQQVVLEIRSGAHKGEKVDAYSLNGYLYGANCKVGTKVIASLSEYDGMLSANVYNYDREAAIAVLLAVFFGLMWLVGGKKGFNSILALIFTFVAVIVHSDDVYWCVTVYRGNDHCGHYHAGYVYPDRGFPDEIHRSNAWHDIRRYRIRTDRAGVRTFWTCHRI